MDIDSLFMTALLKSKKPQYLKGLTDKHFDGEWKKIYRFVRDFFRNHGKLPAPTTVKQKFKDAILLKASETAPFYADELRSRYSLGVLDEMMQKHYTPARNDGDIDTTLTSMKEVIQAVQRTQRTKAKDGGIRRVTENIKARRAAYKIRKAKKGMLGIPTPWKTLDRVTQGWQPGDVAVFLARPKIGKTFLAMLLAIHAMIKGFSVLFASMEMLPKRLEVRYDSLGAKISPEKNRKGILSPKEKKKLDAWWKFLEINEDIGVFDLAGQDEIAAPLDLELALALGEYDLIVWDAFYLAAKKKQWEEFSQLVGDVKKIAGRNQIPVILTSQFNRDVKKAHAMADTAAAAFTDSIVQDADFVFALFQPPALKMMKQMMVSSLAVREGVELTEMMLSWDIDGGDFSELNATLLSDATGDPEIDTEVDLPF